MSDDARMIMTEMVCEIVAAHYGLPKEEVSADFQIRLPYVFLGARLLRISNSSLMLSEGMKVSELVDQILNPPPRIFTDEDLSFLD